jgi:shikimate dehydrogenase
MHTHWIKQYGLQGAYVALAVAPANLETALRSLPALGFAGCNLTIPHKVAAMAIVDHVDPLALRIGAINTIVVEADGSLTGKNTDAFGFIHSLRNAQAHWRGDAGAAVVLGAGGAARAVLAGLLDAGCPEVRLCNRTFATAQSLATEFGTRVHALPWQERNEALRGAAVLVNTTNQGMQGESALDITLDALPLDALVSDIVYVPLQTPLLQAAKVATRADERAELRSTLAVESGGDCTLDVLERDGGVEIEGVLDELDELEERKLVRARPRVVWVVQLAHHLKRRGHDRGHGIDAILGGGEVRQILQGAHESGCVARQRDLLSVSRAHAYLLLVFGLLCLGRLLLLLGRRRTHFARVVKCFV